MKKAKPKSVPEPEPPPQTVPYMVGDDSPSIYDEEPGYGETLSAELADAEEKARRADRRRIDALKCPYLWPNDQPKFRRPSDQILEPIRVALRALPCYRIIIRRVETAAEKKYLREERMPSLFGEQLPGLETQLGRLLLTAILEGDQGFPEVVAAALKDANRLFHRGKVLDSFFKWRGSLPAGTLQNMTIGQIQEAFIVYLGRDELSGAEWKRIKEEFVLQDVPRGKPGPKAKSKHRK